MAEGEGGSAGEGPGGAGDRGGRGLAPLRGYRSVRLPALSRAGRARPCPRRVERAALEVSGRWRGPRADTPGWGRRAAGGFASQEGAWGGRGRWELVRTCRRALPVGGGSAGAAGGSHPSRVSSLRALAEAFPGAARAACAAALVTGARALLSGSGEICRAPGVLAGSIEDCQLHHSD